jgi:hypothetical protein
MLVSDNQYGRDQFASVVNRLVASQPQPLNLVGVNLDLEDDILLQLGCNQDETKNLADSGYRDRFYLCN